MGLAINTGLSSSNEARQNIPHSILKMKTSKSYFLHLVLHSRGLCYGYDLVEKLSFFFCFNAFFSKMVSDFDKFLQLCAFKKLSLGLH